MRYQDAIIKAKIERDEPFFPFSVYYMQAKS